nr:formate dehydrogenase subunit alpha [Rhodococcus rhodochrous]
MCAEVQGTFALELSGRGFDTVVSAGDGGAWVDSPCVSCGGCVDSCPTGALTEPGLRDPHPITGTTDTTCGYCGVGCTLTVHTRGTEIAAITPARDGPVNRGHACVKGRFAHGFLHADDRLDAPLVRSSNRSGPLRKTTWTEAITHAADELVRIRDRHGPQSIGVICSARATNEENYLAQKFARVVLGTNNIDNCSRLCHAPSAVGLTRSLGYAGGTNTIEDLDRADCILVVGANPTEAHPVVGARITQRVLAGAKLIVIDPRRTQLADLADVHLQARAGSNVAVFNALAHLLISLGYLADDFLAERTTGLTELIELSKDYPADRVAHIAEVSADRLKEAGRLFGEAHRPIIIYGLGVTEHLHGTDGVRTLVNLALLRGAIGTDQCCGVLPLRGQNNVQGASDMGALPDLLPGYQPLGSDAVRARFSEAWDRPLPARPGLRIPQMFDAACAGELRALYVIGEDVAASDPNTAHVREALASCELLICHDLFPSETARVADIVFPAAAFLEKDGTFVNFDRRFQRVRPAVAPPAGAWTDFDIISSVARAMGVELGCATPSEAMDECARLAPLFAGISHRRLDREGPLHWPCPDCGQPGQATLYLEGFATGDGRAHLAALPYLAPGEAIDADYPYVLVTGRRLAHYNTGSMTRRTPDIDLGPRESVDLHPRDAATMGVRTGDTVEVRSRRGAVRLTATVTDETAPGTAFCDFHFPHAPVNALTSARTDEDTGCPEYKISAVAIRPVAR